MTEKNITRRVILTFSGHAAGQPIVNELVKKHDLQINIYRARITPKEEGYLAVDLTGSEENIASGLAYIESFNININETGNSLLWDEDKCVGCGNCLSHCPTEALYIAEPKSRKVKFNGEKCIECMSCIRNCPFGACSSLF
ncbi:MAG: 4Fe-4S binding protein [Spirochaetales bacterium]|nr:4Fe-4S binding protein [Spirochaetales bacterium]